MAFKNPILGADTKKPETAARFNDFGAALASINANLYDVASRVGSSVSSAMDAVGRTPNVDLSGLEVTQNLSGANISSISLVGDVLPGYNIVPNDILFSLSENIRANASLAPLYTRVAAVNTVSRDVHEEALRDHQRLLQDIQRGMVERVYSERGPSNPFDNNEAPLAIVLKGKRRHAEISDDEQRMPLIFRMQTAAEADECIKVLGIAVTVKTASQQRGITQNHVITCVGSGLVTNIPNCWRQHRLQANVGVIQVRPRRNGFDYRRVQRLDELEPITVVPWSSMGLKCPLSLAYTDDELSRMNHAMLQFKEQYPDDDTISPTSALMYYGEQIPTCVPGYSVLSAECDQTSAYIDVAPIAIQHPDGTRAVYLKRLVSDGAFRSLGWIVKQYRTGAMFAPAEVWDMFMHDRNGQKWSSSRCRVDLLVR